ncbi:MAG: ferritin-like domain-containing protein [Thermoleophilaceae bacterium]
MADERSAVEVPQRSAMRDLAEDPSSRKRFLKMVGGAGAVSAFGLFLAACGDDEEDDAARTGTQTQQEGGGDLEIVNYALTLEYLEADFYQQVLDSGEITDQALVETAMLIAENEQEHVDALMATAQQLGEPAPKPTTNFDDVLAGGRDVILETAAQVENIGAAAYLGQAGNIEDKEILAAALAIHTVEGRHAAALNNVIGESIVPDGAFAVPMSMDEVLEAVQPFIAS